MKYKEYTGSIEELVGRKLKEIEERENIRVLHAAESGSRAWGIASPLCCISSAWLLVIHCISKLFP